MCPLWSASPPSSCTSKCRCPSVRFAASRTRAKTSGSMSSTVSPFARRSRMRTVVSARSASPRRAVSSSRVFTRAAIFRSRRSSPSFESNRPPIKLTGTRLLRSLRYLQRELDTRWTEERADRLAFVDAADRLREQRRDGEHSDLGVVPLRGTERHAVRGDELDDAAARDLLRGVARKQGMRAADVDLPYPALLQDLHRVEDRGPGVDLVVDDDRAPAVDLADDADDLASAAVVAVRLLHEDEGDIERLGDAARGVRVAEVGDDERDVLRVRLDDRAKMLDEQDARRELVAGDAEEALDLHLVHVHGEEAIRAGHPDEVREEARGDRDARLVLLVAPPVGVVRHDRGDATGGRALEGVEHDEELHDRVAHRWPHERLHDEDVVLAGVLLDLDEDVVVRELEHVDLAERDLEMAADITGEAGVRVTGVDR